jgi:hypothetical protein
MKMGKRNGKRKRKRDFQLAGPGGDFGPPGASVRAGACLRPSWPSREGATAGDSAVARRPHARERGVVNDVDGNGRRGVRPEPSRRRNPAAILRR